MELQFHQGGQVHSQDEHSGVHWQATEAVDELTPSHSRGKIQNGVNNV